MREDYWHCVVADVLSWTYLRSEQEAKELGAQMVFITLRKDRASPLEPLADVASRWKEVVLSMTYLSSLSFRLTLVLVRVAFAAQALWNGGLEVTVYEIEEGKKLLVGLQRGIQIADLRKFLSEQPDVLEFEWNSEMYVNDNKQQQQKKGRKARKKEKRAATKSSKKKRKHATHTSSMQEPRSEL